MRRRVASKDEHDFLWKSTHASDRWIESPLLTSSERPTTTTLHQWSPSFSKAPPGVLCVLPTEDSKQPVHWLVQELLSVTSVAMRCESSDLPMCSLPDGSLAHNNHNHHHHHHFYSTLLHRLLWKEAQAAIDIIGAEAVAAISRSIQSCGVLVVDWISGWLSHSYYGPYSCLQTLELLLPSLSQQRKHNCFSSIPRTPHCPFQTRAPCPGGVFCHYRRFVRERISQQSCL